MDLHSLARSYLQAGGYQIGREAYGFLDLTHPEPSRGQPARLLVWSDDSTLTASRALTASERTDRDKREQALLAAFKTEMSAAPGAVGFYLVPRRLGQSTEFASRAGALLRSPAGGVRVPIQFFDTPYKREQTGEAGTRSRKARSAVDDLLGQVAKVRRVAQPFLIRRGLGPNDCVPVEGDLVEHLETTLMDPGAIRLRFIDGSAGSGKTVAFNALLDSSIKEFRAAKAEQLQRRRPIAFLPDHIRGEAIGYVDDVIDAAVEADMAQTVEPEQLRWLLSRGFATWMFDGLDEFYAGDNDFFKFLEDELADPNSQAQFLICARDSLLSSSDAMRAFIERQLQRGGRIEIYALAPWDAKRWAQMAWLELENGRKGAEGSARVRQFVSALEGSATLADLAKLPFYCAVMLETFKAQKKMPKDEFELLQSIVDRMVEREHGKDIFRWEDFVDIDALSESIDDLAVDQKVAASDTANTRAILAEVLDGEGRSALFELIEALAHDYRRNPDAATAANGLGLEDLRNFYGRTYAASNLGDPEVSRLVTVLVQFAFFGQGRRAGSIDFTHHILADYLAARYAARLLRGAVAQDEQAGASGRRASLSDVTRRVSTFRQAIGTAPLVAGSTFHRYLAQEMQRDAKLGSFVQGMRGVDLGRDNVTAALRTLAP
jgi:hypothetical protein